MVTMEHKLTLNNYLLITLINNLYGEKLILESFKNFKFFILNFSFSLQFKKSCITFNFSSELPHRYFSWILTRFLSTTLFQSISFPEQFFYFLIKIWFNQILLTEAFSNKKVFHYFDHSVAEHT